MQYRKFGSLGFEVSVLGFGCMRLPVLDHDSSRIDEERAIPLVRHGIERGINYIDTAYGYHGGKSEEFVGKVLKDGFREKVYVATKLPTYRCKDPADPDRLLAEQLARLGIDHIDLYLLHGLDGRDWDELQRLDICRWLDRTIAQGSIGHAGFSFHGDIDSFESILDAYPWAFCQIQLNYMDVDYQAGLRGLRYAAARGVPVVVMEPLKGGKLGTRPPREVEAIWDEAPRRRTPAEWALRWVCNFPEVGCVLSGMNSMEQLEENLSTVEDALPHSLTVPELELFDRVREVYARRIQVSCTECSYCLPCPQGVSIPEVFSLYNDGHMYGVMDQSRRWYQRMLKSSRGTPSCTACGECESKCPQKLPIVQLLQDAHLRLSRDETS